MLESLKYFAALLLFQLCLWRYLKKTTGRVCGEILWLFVIFCGGPLLLGKVTGNPEISLLLLSLGLVYLFLFPAASAKSPSLEVIKFVKKNPGVSEQQIITALAKKSLVTDRIQDLERDFFTHRRDGKIALTFWGSLVSFCFITYRKIIGLPLGEG